jgi:hypothetical protein
VEPTSVHGIQEEKFKTGLLRLIGVPATIVDSKNGNGRTYSTKVIEKALGALKKNRAFENKKMLCAADDHPKESYVPPIRASHVVTNAYLKEIEGKKHLLNDWLILNTDNGKNLKSLINAGVSIGTSIRGLGQLDEETKHVQEYDYLGTDAVGNPSAGTYAHSGKYEVKVESVSDEEAREITESLNNAPKDSGENSARVREGSQKLDLESFSDPLREKLGIDKLAEGIKDLQSKIIEQSNSRQSTEARTPMAFDLRKSIEEFKTKYIEENKAKDPTSRDMIESLMNIQRDAVEAGIKDISELDKLTDLIYGKAVEPVKPNGHDRTQEVNQDVLNRTLRELEATENLAVHFKTELEKLKEDLEKSKQETEAYERVSEAYDKVAVSIYEELQETVSRLSMDVDDTENKKLSEKFIQIVKNIQREAQDVIINYEARLENAIRVGDVFAENAIVLRRIAGDLYNKFLEIQDNDPESFISSRSTNISMQERRALAAQDRGRNNQSLPRQSLAGSRTGWV